MLFSSCLVFWWLIAAKLRNNSLTAKYLVGFGGNGWHKFINAGGWVRDVAFAVMIIIARRISGIGQLGWGKEKPTRLGGGLGDHAGKESHSLAPGGVGEWLSFVR